MVYTDVYRKVVISSSEVRRDTSRVLTMAGFQLVGDELVTVRVLLFASARELAGRSEGLLTDVPSRTDERHLIQRVTDAFSLKPMSGSFILALNHDYVKPGESVCIREGDELAVIPPLSGG